VGTRRRAGDGLVGLLAGLGLGVCAGAAWAGAYPWSLPEGVAPPPVPVDNPMSTAKVELGRRLFGDVRLSFNLTTSCASCHDPERDFSDGLPRSIGADGRSPARHTPSLWNVAYNASFTWIDQGFTSLEEQLRVPLTGRDPVELGFDAAGAAALAADPAIAALQREAFGDAALDATTVVRALAAYLRTLVRMDGPFDRLLYWDDDSGFGAVARAGRTLFFSERLGCSACHAGPHLAGPTVAPGRSVAPVFHRTAVSDSALAFRAPSLRFVSRTAPYMHDGSLETLDAVVDFYARGGGKGAERLVPFSLAPGERRALLAFLAAL
jgi:cytochrome c peroxidase